MIGSFMILAVYCCILVNIVTNQYDDESTMQGLMKMWNTCHVR